MRIIGKRVEQPITFHANGELLKKGAQFNDEMHKMFNIKHNGIPKGVYFFKTHEEANKHKEDCIVKNIASIAMRKRNGI